MKRLLPVVIIILFVVLAGCARRGEERITGQGEAVVTSPTALPGTGAVQATATAHVCTYLKPVIILVEFPDAGHRIERQWVEYRFNTQVNDYIREVSYGKYCLKGEVTEKWYKMPLPVGDYQISSKNLEVNRTRVAMLIHDALEAADADLDYAKYDFGIIQLGVNTSDYGMVGLCGHPGMLGWTDTSVLKAESGEVLKGGIAIYTAQAHLGTNFHDIAHILGGVKDGKRQVPCLYDHDIQAQTGPLINAIVNLGFFDPLSCHYYKWSLPPPGICSWTRIRLGWMDPAKICTVDKRETTEVILGALEDPGSETLVVRIPLTDQTYYLIENRQPIGVDRYLPAHGVLIMYADDRIPECRHGLAPVKLIDANPGIPHLEGAPFDVGGNDDYVDENHNIRIELLEKAGNDYRIRIGPAR